MSRPRPTTLWRLGGPGGVVECRLEPGCGVVELVVERGGEVLRREAYPHSPTAYERARTLRAEYERAAPESPGG